MTRPGAGTGRSITRDGRGFEISIEFGGTVTVIHALPGEFLLDAAARQGLWLPRTCRQGWCASCAAYVREGAAEHSAAKRFFAADDAAGFALLCSARALSPMRILAGAHQAFREHRITSGLPVPRGGAAGGNPGNG